MKRDALLNQGITLYFYLLFNIQVSCDSVGAYITDFDCTFHTEM